DLLLGFVVLGVAVTQLALPMTLAHAIGFVLTLLISGMLLYAILLAFASLTFWSPGFLFGWVFDGLFQMARYPVGLYPGVLRLVLTWIVPVGVITTVPARALSGDLPPALLAGSFALSAAAVLGASVLFRTGLRRYASASS